MYFQEVLGLYSQDVKVAEEYFRCYDMDAEDLAKAALSAIYDWLDEEIVGFWTEHLYYQSMPNLTTSMIMKKLAIFLTFICLISFIFGQVPISPKSKVVPIPPKPIEQPKEALSVKFRGTLKDFEKEFFSTEEEGIDIVRDRKTKKLITGSLTVTEADGKVLGVVNLLKGKMHGEELFFDDNGKVKERNYWINGKPSKTLPPKLIPPKREPVRPNSIVAKKFSNKKMPNRIVSLFHSNFFQFKFKSKEEKAFWDSLPNWNRFRYNDLFKDINKIHTHKLDALGNIIDENSTKGYTGSAKIVLDFFLGPGRMILQLKDGYIVKVETFYLDGNKCVQQTYKDGKEDGLFIRNFHSKGQKITNFKDGRKEGLETEVDANGQKEREVNFKDGRKEGTETFWYENGRKSWQFNWKNGKREGTETSWYKNGQKKQEVNYKDGRKEGNETFWYENGRKCREQNTIDGILQGISTFWYENGQKHAEISFTDGYLMSANVWKPNGEISKESKVTEGNGKIIYYDSEGKEIYHVSVEDGKTLKSQFPSLRQIGHF